MTFDTLDTVVLKRDVPKHALRAGDLGVIVETYYSDGFEVEFVAPSGETKAVLTLTPRDVRAVTPADMVAVRTV